MVCACFHVGCCQPVGWSTALCSKVCVLMHLLGLKPSALSVTCAGTTSWSCQGVAQVLPRHVSVLTPVVPAPSESGPSQARQ